MSDIVEKTLASFPRFLSEGLLGVAGTSPSKHDIPSGLRQLIVAIHSVRSKSDEEKIIKDELAFLQQRLSQPNQSNQQIRETYSRLIYCVTLGYDASFAIIHVVKMAQQGTGMQKRLGYLLSCLLLHENHEMLILLINTIQKDLKSTNLLDNCMGLIAASQLLSAENIPMFLPLVLDKLKHQRELVRLKAVHCLYQFYLKAPGMVSHSQPSFKTALADKDPGVIHGAVHIYIAMAQENPSEYRHLGSSFVAILKQIVNQSFPAIHEFKGVPLPWLQIQLVKVLGILGVHDEGLKLEMYPVLKAVIKRSVVKQNIAFAVLYECIRTVARVRGDADLLMEVSQCVTKFLQSSNPTIKYLGVKALTALVDVSAEYAVPHQIAVVECLDGEDVAIQRKTLDLLFMMANQNNVKAICSKLFEHLRKTDDLSHKADLAGKLSQLVEKYSPNTQWYIDSINAVLLQTTGDNTALITRLMHTIEQDLQSQEDEEFENYLVTSYLPFLQKETCPTSLLHLSLWVIGELNHGLKITDNESVVSAVMTPLTRDDTGRQVKMQALTSLMRLVVKGVLDMQTVQQVLEQRKHVFDDSPQLQQKFHEILRFVSLSTAASQSKNRTNSKHDFTLSFLDDYVCASLETSGVPYRSAGHRMVVSQTPEKEDYGVLYEEMFSPGRPGSHPPSTSRTDSVSLSNTSDSSEHAAREAGLHLSGVKRVWGRDGIMERPGYTTTPSDTDVTKAKEVNKKQQLAHALFEGISSDVKETNQEKQSNSNSETSGGIISDHSVPESYLPSVDSSGWRAFSAKRTSNNDQIEQDENSFSDIKTGIISTDGVSSVNVMSSNLDVMSSESVLTSIITSSKENQSANFNVLEGDKLDSECKSEPSMYDEFTKQGVDEDVLVDETYQRDEIPHQSLYANYDGKS